MKTQKERATLLQDLHVKGDLLILFNIWDAGSARALAEIGARVIGTGSWSVAAAHGCSDGQELSFALALANLKRIVASVDLPVTIDLEGGYGISPAEVRETAAQVIAAGAVGINFEDQIVGGDGLYEVEDQCARIAAIRAAAEQAAIAFFINARTDIFLKTDPASHSDHHLDEAVQRLPLMRKLGRADSLRPA